MTNGMANGGASWHGMRPDGQGDSGSWAASQQQQHGGMGGGHCKYHNVHNEKQIT